MIPIHTIVMVILNYPVIIEPLYLLISSYHDECDYAAMLSGN